MAASSLTVKRFLSSSGGLLSKSLFRPVASSSCSFNANVTLPLLRPVAAYRYFNTNAPQQNQHRNDADHPSFDFPNQFSKFHRVLGEFLNTAYQFIDNLIGEGFYVKEKDDSLSLSHYMYGLEKEDVEISVDHKTLTLTFKGKNKNQNEGCGHGFYVTYDLTGKPYRIDEIKAKIKKDGLLKIVVPKMKMDDVETHERITVKIE